jgi:hypothetical protein
MTELYLKATAELSIVALVGYPRFQERLSEPKTISLHL